MAIEVVLSEHALDDLFAIWLHIAESSGASRADDVIGRLRASCLGLSRFPNRGAPRDELEPGLRSVPFRRWATVYYRVGEERVEIVRVLYRGRDAGHAFGG